ncbi:TPA: hypothetical protein DDZ86_03980 [Candidatus Dependentiae bacterium]|nr:hypothetical protein [Candidatus Dependentiae bacterium]
MKSVESSVTSAKTPLSTPSVKTPSSVNNPQNKVVFKPVDFNKKVENFSFYPELQAPETEKESKFLLQLYGTYNYGVCWLALCEYSEQNKNIEDMLNFLLVESESVKKSRLAYMVGFDAFPVWSFALRHTIDLLFKYAQGNELEEHCKRLSDAIEKVKPLALKDDWMSELRMNAYLDEIKTRKELGA